MRALHFNRVLIRYRIGLGLLFAVFTLPVLVPYYAGKGIDASGFFFIEALFRFVYFLAGFVAGPISDHGSRRGTILMGAGLWWLGSFVIFMGQGPLPVVAGETLLGIGMALFVSSGRAYLYDFLLSYERAAEHPRHLSIQRGLENGFRMLAMAAGGFLFVTWAEAPQLAVLVTTSIAIAILLFIPEPSRHKPLERPAGFPALFRLFHAIGTRHKGLLNLMLFNSVIISGTAVVFWGIQPALRINGLSIPYIGLALAAAAAVTAFFMTVGHTIFARLGARSILIVILPMILIELVALALTHHPAILLLLILNSFVFSMVSVGIEDIVQKQVGSDIRASTLSLGLMLDMVMSSFALMLMGVMSKVASLPLAFAIVAALVAVFGSVFLVLLLRVFSQLKTI